MKKYLILIITLVAGFLLVSCNDDIGNKPSKIQLTYADWGDKEFNQKMIDAFMEENENIIVNIVDIGGSGAEFTGNLIDSAQLGILPDVFAIDNVPTIVSANLALDVEEYWRNDPDAQLVYEAIAETAVYNGKRYAVPSYQFLKGIFVNLSIMEKLNLQTVTDKYRIDADGYPVKDWTVTEMVEIAKAVTNPTVGNKEEYRSGLALWYGAADFQQIWPMLNDENLRYDTWDGENFDFENPLWIEAMKAKVDIMDNVKYPHVTSNFPADETTQAFLGELGWMIAEGYSVMAIDGSWNFGAVTTAKDNNQELGFWPYPAGDAGQFPPTILDYQIVSSQTRYPEEAYKLAKWMTYGKDGWMTRLDLLEERRAEEIAEGENITYLDRFPIADYPEVWARVDAFLHDDEGKELIVGMNSILANIDDSRPDLDKWLAGYKDFWGWVEDEDNPYNWVNLLAAGPDAVPTYAKEWNDKANELVHDAIENLGRE